MEQSQALDLIGEGYTPAYIESLKIRQVNENQTVNQTSPNPQATEALANRWGITLASARAVMEDNQ